MSLAAVIFVSLVTTAVGQSSSTDTTAPSVDQAAQTTQTAQTAQKDTQTGSSDSLPVSLDRIRKALDETPTAAADAPRPKLKVDTSTVPVFRTQTQGTTIRLTPVLDDGTNVGAYVRPPYGPYDYEFKQMVTPDAVKGCGRLTTTECLQLYGNKLASALMWNYVTQKKPATAPAPTAPDPETQRIRAQIQQELLDQQAASSQTPPSKP